MKRKGRNSVKNQEQAATPVFFSPGSWKVVRRQSRTPVQ
jgi:hypothetical protein